MSEWKEYSLKQLLGRKGYIRGPFGSALKRGEMKTEGIPVYEQQHAIYDTRNFRYYIDKLKFQELERFSTKTNDLIISCSGTVGEISVIQNNDPKGIISQALLTLRPNVEIISPKFLYYFFKTRHGHNELIVASHGSVQVNIAKREIVENIKIKVPSTNTQNVITEILSSLDDKIELNNQINKNLEALAQELFKRWFVDFEFPGKNGQPYKSSGGVMVESELGEIPEGWCVGALSDISDITIGRTPPRKESVWFTEDSSDVKWVSIRDMGNAGVYIYNTAEYLTEEAVKKFNIPIVHPNTVMISFKLTVGRISISTERMLSNEAIAHVNLTNESLFPEFMYLTLKNFNFDSLGSTSSIATAVNSKSIKSLPVIIPACEVLNQFQMVVIDIFNEIKNNTFTNKELVQLRDTLLPKLISGELTVNDIQA